MKLILSRKGFDSSSGGVPSPIFPDGRMLSLPIPDKYSPIRYADILWPGTPSVGEIVERLTQGRVTAHYRAHLDPDVCVGSLPRGEGWRPVFGQAQAAQAHLANCRVHRGDVFLFFGLFRRVVGASLEFASSTLSQHVIFAWMQVGDIVEVAACAEREMRWALYHPHMHRRDEPRSTLYVATERLVLPRAGELDCAGAGLFDRYSDSHRLTAPAARKVSQWLLPEWFAPAVQKPALTYHGDLTRWQRAEGGVLLNSVGRGQEFVLECENRPEAEDWVAGLLRQ